MAELTTIEPRQAFDCCSTEAQTSCCEPAFDPADTGAQTFGATLYGQEGEHAPREAVDASLGCGVPTAVADLHEGEIVLDLGSGAGADVFITARRVGPSGKAIGLDMTDEVLELARANAASAGASNVEFVKRYLEAIPLPDAAVNVVISNCVINLAADKHKVLAQAARVLRPGGRFAVSDVIADPDMDAATRADMAAFTGCIAGALTRSNSAPRSPRPALPISRSARRTASTSTRAPRSCAPASLYGARDEYLPLDRGRRGARADLLHVAGCCTALHTHRRALPPVLRRRLTLRPDRGSAWQPMLYCG